MRCNDSAGSSLLGNQHLQLSSMFTFFDALCPLLLSVSDVLLSQVYREKPEVFLLTAKLFTSLVTVAPQFGAVCSEPEHAQRLTGIVALLERKVASSNGSSSNSSSRSLSQQQQQSAPAKSLRAMHQLANALLVCGNSSGGGSSSGSSSA
jgi:hypothetical protein